MSNSQTTIEAVVLAAGQSRRMGQPKLVMPLGDRTVIERVVLDIQAGGIDKIIVVTGGAKEAIEEALKESGVRIVFNPLFDQTEMITSLQAGIRTLSPGCQAMLIALGDQPSIEPEVIRLILNQYDIQRAKLIIPSYQMRRGHPWLVARDLWDELLALHEDQSMRDFLHSHEEEITYVNVESPSILRDLDTPEDYQELARNFRSKNSKP